MLTFRLRSWLSAFLVLLLVVPILVASAVLFGRSVTLVTVRDKDEEVLLHLLAAANNGGDPYDLDLVRRSFEVFATDSARPEIGLVLFVGSQPMVSNYTTPSGFDLAAAAKLASGGAPEYRLHSIRSSVPQSLLVWRHDRKYDFGTWHAFLTVPIAQWRAGEDITWDVIQRKAARPFFFAMGLVILAGACVVGVMVSANLRLRGLRNDLQAIRRQESVIGRELETAEKALRAGPNAALQDTVGRLMEDKRRLESECARLESAGREFYRAVLTGRDWKRRLGVELDLRGCCSWTCFDVLKEMEDKARRLLIRANLLVPAKFSDQLAGLTQHYRMNDTMRREVWRAWDLRCRLAHGDYRADASDGRLALAALHLLLGLQSRASAASGSAVSA